MRPTTRVSRPVKGLVHDVNLRVTDYLLRTGESTRPFEWARERCKQAFE